MVSMSQVESEVLYHQLFPSVSNNHKQLGCNVSECHLRHANYILPDVVQPPWSNHLLGRCVDGVAQ